MDKQAEGSSLHQQEISWHSQTDTASLDVIVHTETTRLPAHQMEPDQTDKYAERLSPHTHMHLAAGA